jgi:hypothetical protein
MRAAHQLEQVAAVALDARRPHPGHLEQLLLVAREPTADLVEARVREHDVRRHAVVARALEPPVAQARGQIGVCLL